MPKTPHSNSAPESGSTGTRRRRDLGTLLVSPRDAILNVVLLLLIVPSVLKVAQWGFWDDTCFGASRESCQGGGACWPFVTHRMGPFLYGFYPEAERWRVNLATIASVLYGVMAWRWLRGRWLWGSTIAIVVSTTILLKGGTFGLLPVETSQWGGLFLTVYVSALASLGSLPIGIVLALGRRSSLPVIRTLSTLLIETVRGVPLITVLFLASLMVPLVLPPGTKIDKLLRVILGMTIFSGAYMAEVVRGGLTAVPKGQAEAALALGLSRWDTLTQIVLPQALRHVVPAILNTLIGLFKDTTLVLIVGMFDFLGMIQAATSDPLWFGSAVEGYVFAATVYFVLCFGMSKLSRAFETKSESP